MAADRGTGSVPRRVDARLLDRDEDVSTIRPIRFEKLEHAIVITPILTSQSSRDHVRHVAITDGDGVPVAVCLAHHDRCRPWPNSFDRQQSPFSVVAPHRENLGKPLPSPGNFDERRGASPLDTVDVQLVM